MQITLIVLINAKTLLINAGKEPMPAADAGRTERVARYDNAAGTPDPATPFRARVSPSIALSRVFPRLTFP
ncbi:hypothetical protein KB20921_12530 [Edwardsiella ictaluri]|nr:hypothetical protein KH20906_12230 [Edwardsiella ictaluri]BEI01992.1 hypothetical protein KB20921_12530 [Edwardsiella ictaluri]BEI05461.1 hypothetical protein KH201010_12470 [Edwardsiella ictaluri]BEI08920.1 hypothetical protein STU22726_12510 [Edwardsiella ictaluri]BEI12397.1 hypothetical protein STU22816_12500 [Edwardsiella ictaluri]